MAGRPEAVTIGEALIDFVSVEHGVSLRDAPSFLKAAGGGPANVAVGLARLNVQSAFIGRVGDDPFGHFLASTLRDEGVDISQLTYDEDVRTGLAFVSLTAHGERDFLFYRHPAADMRLDVGHFAPEAIAGAQCIEYGSISLIAEPSRRATLEALAIAREHGVTRVCDPNLRLNLWENSEAARQGVGLALSRADVVKMSVEELEFITSEPDPLEALGGLSHSPDRLVVVTAGKAGCFHRAGGMVQHIPGFEVEVVDTTGAGDAFLAAMIAGLLQHGFSAELDVLEGTLRAANAAGALACTRRGAIPALPSRHRLDEFLADTASPAMR